MSGSRFPVGRCTLLVNHHGIPQPSGLVLEACFLLKPPFRSMLLTTRGGPCCLAPRTHRYLYIRWCFHIPISSFHGAQGSSDTCISDGVFHIPMPCFHGARRGLGSLSTPLPPHLPRPRDGGGALADPRRASSGDPARVGDSLAHREELTQNVGRRFPLLPAL